MFNIKLKTKLKKLTLFDLILITGFILGAVFFAFVFFRKPTYLNVRVKVGEYSVLYQPWNIETGSKVWFSQYFYKGMREKDGLGRDMALITGVRSYDSGQATKAVYLDIKLRVVYSRGPNQYSFKGKPLVIGSTQKFNLDGVLVEGLVTDVEGIPDPRERETLIVEAQVREESSTFQETSGTEEYLADSIKVGDKVTDSNGNVVVEVLGKRVENAKRAVTTSDGRVLIGTNPLRKDFYLTLKINSLKIGGKYFLFDDVPILIGQSIPINTPLVSIFPEVTKIAPEK